MEKRFLVAVKGMDVFVFDSKENANAFIETVKKHKPDAQWAVCEMGDDRFEQRGG